MNELRTSREVLLREMLELGAKEKEHMEKSQLMEETMFLKIKVLLD